MPPTLNSMQVRHLDLYPSRICRLCEDQGEYNQHLWTCSAATATITTIWKDAMAKIDGWGDQATNRYSAAKEREYNRAVANGRQVPCPVLVRWRCPSEAEHVKGFFSIGGARAVLSGHPVPDLVSNTKWTVSDLLRGITPKTMLKGWAAAFTTPLAITQWVIHKFVGHLETQASELLWKTRCSATVEWEQTVSITARGKASNYVGPRGDWSDGRT
ncbi:hypothetical protein BGX23_012459 [Mortierella sp. AD031]|nr:hypothetical protein BGX23_012459 [Mortierella sp. AD031]